MDLDRDHAFKFVKLLKWEEAEVLAGRLQGLMGRNLRLHSDRHAQAVIVIDATNTQRVEGEVRGLGGGQATHLTQRLTHKRHERFGRDGVARVGDPLLGLTAETWASRRE